MESAVFSASWASVISRTVRSSRSFFICYSLSAFVTRRPNRHCLDAYQPDPSLPLTFVRPVTSSPISCLENNITNVDGRESVAFWMEDRKRREGHIQRFVCRANGYLIHGGGVISCSTNVFQSTGSSLCSGR